MNKYKYKRVLIKLSGEALGSKSDIYSKDNLHNIAKQLVELANNGLEIGVVIGGGNIWRGKLSQEIGIPKINADYIGMLATVMNGLALESAIGNLGYSKVEVYSSLSIETMTNEYNFKKVRFKLSSGFISIFVGGTGYAYFTTDTNSVIRAYEIDAEVILMAKNGVKGVYDKDPNLFDDAKLFTTLTHDDVAQKQLRVMDLTAATLAKDANLKIEVFDMNGENNIVKLLQGKLESTIIK